MTDQTTPPAPVPDVQGHCPACGRETLFLSSGGYITCRRIDCPNPDAANTLLERRPTPREWLRTGTRDLSIPDHDDGPSVREAAAADRNWDVEKAGE